MTIDGKEVKFFRSDGSPAQGGVGEGGVTENGEVCFYEIIGMERPKLNGKNKYARILVRRVYPYMECEEVNNEKVK